MATNPRLTHQVYFKQQKAQTLSTLRRRCAMRTLHVRPTGRVKQTEVPAPVAGELWMVS